MKNSRGCSIIVFIYTLMCGGIFGQTNVNVVPNPSFEQFSLCPNQVDDFFALGWEESDFQGASSDTYNACGNIPAGSGLMGVPINLMNVGNPNVLDGLNAHSGVGYAGIVTTEPGNQIEFISTSIQVESGIEYDISFFASLASRSQFATRLMISFTTTDFTDLPFSVSGNDQLQTLNVIDNAGTWTEITFKKTFDQSGTYYLMIGNFGGSANAQVSATDPTGNSLTDYAYYYIDDVSVKPSPGCCPNDLIIDNQTLSGTFVFGANNTVTVGPNVDVTAGADITFTAGNTVTFEPPFNGGPGTNAIIGECPGELQIKSTDIIPNVITPNNDGINDHICVAIFGGTHWSVEIFGRFGNRVFVGSGAITTQPVCIWDGSCNQGFPNCIGSNLSDGEYIVILKVMGCDRPDGEFTQMVTLFDSNLRLAGPQSDTAVTWGTIAQRQDSASSDYLSLHPNPSTGNFMIVVPVELQSSDYIVEVVDALGERVYFLSSSFSQGKSEINIDGLASGTYFVFIRNSSTQYFSQIVIAK